MLITGLVLMQVKTKKFKDKYFVQKLIQADFHIDHASPDHLQSQKNFLVWEKAVFIWLIVDLAFSGRSVIPSARGKC